MEGKALGIDDLVAQYREAGEHESTGSFTLDRQKAQERLAGFALQNSYDWILKVIQSLVYSGAMNIDIDAGVNQVKIVADAVPPGFEAIEDVLAHLLTDAKKAAPALRHLAAGLQASLAVSPSHISTKLLEQGRERRFVVVKGGWKSEPPLAAASSASRFEMLVKRNLSESLNASWNKLNTDIFDLFFKSEESYDKENAAVNSRCDYTKCDIRLKGKSVTKRSFGLPRFRGYEIWNDLTPGKRKPSAWLGMWERDRLVDGLAYAQHHLVEWVEVCPDGRGFHLPEPSHATVTNRRDPEFLSQHKGAGLRRAYAIQMRLSGKGEFHLVEDGVVIQSPDLPIECPGFLAVVDASSLPKDVSTMKVIEDEAYQQLLVEVELAAQNLKTMLAENLDKMPGPKRIKKLIPSLID